MADFFSPTTFKLKEHLTQEEKEERSRLLLAIAEKVLEIPVEDASHDIRWDGFFDPPSATVLAHIQEELIPETRILERGDLDRPGGTGGGRIAPGPGGRCRLPHQPGPWPPSP